MTPTEGSDPETINGQLSAATTRLAVAGVPEPRADAEVLLAHVLGVSRTTLFVRARTALAAADQRRFEVVLARRIVREPVFHIVGEREFWSLPFVVDRRVLTPRPETEGLVEAACRVAPHARRVLDAGTGSGCIAVAVARTLPRAQVWALDRSADALAVARVNRDRHAPAVELIRGHWLECFQGSAFDLVVANPPYIRSGVLPSLAPEVRAFEPAEALVAGADGLDALRALLADAPRVLAPGGWLVCEIGADQGDAVTALAGIWAERWDEIRLLPDYAGLDRVVAVRVRGN